MTGRARGSFAPKGQHSPAQGNALGSSGSSRRALKGRHNRCQERPRVGTALALVCLLLLTACRGPDWRVSQLYGGGTSVSVLATPKAVEAFRIDPDPRAKDPNDVKAPRLGEYRVTAGPVVLDAATTAELSSILLDPDTYDWQRAKGCDFTPGVGLRFVKDASRVEIALCFECDELMIWRMGRRVGMEDFDDARPRLVAVVKKLFPDDAKIQALK